MELFVVDSKPAKYKLCASGGRSCLSSHHFSHLWPAPVTVTRDMLLFVVSKMKGYCYGS